MANYSAKTNTGECVFCKIIDRTLKTPGIFWEDSLHLAFLSTWPNILGNTVVTTKQHHQSDVLAMEDSKLQDFILAAKKVAKILEHSLTDVGRVGLVMEGTGIDHAHIKLYPMHGTGHLNQGQWKQYHSKIDTYFDKYQGYISSNDGPRANEEDLVRLADKLKKKQHKRHP